jgi:hypothetical protein
MWRDVDRIWGLPRLRKTVPPDHFIRSPKKPRPPIVSSPRKRPSSPLSVGGPLGARAQYLFCAHHFGLVGAPNSAYVAAIGNGSEFWWIGFDMSHASAKCPGLGTTQGDATAGSANSADNGRVPPADVASFAVCHTDRRIGSGREFIAGLRNATGMVGERRAVQSRMGHSSVEAVPLIPRMAPAKVLVPVLAAKVRLISGMNARWHAIARRLVAKTARSGRSGSQGRTIARMVSWVLLQEEAHCRRAWPQSGLTVSVWNPQPHCDRLQSEAELERMEGFGSGASLTAARPGRCAKATSGEDCKTPLQAAEHRGSRRSLQHTPDIHTTDRIGRSSADWRRCGSGREGVQHRAACASSPFPPR